MYLLKYILYTVPLSVPNIVIVAVASHKCSFYPRKAPSSCSSSVFRIFFGPAATPPSRVCRLSEIRSLASSPTAPTPAPSGLEASSDRPRGGGADGNYISQATARLWTSCPSNARSGPRGLHFPECRGTARPGPAHSTWPRRVAGRSAGAGSGSAGGWGKAQVRRRGALRGPREGMVGVWHGEPGPGPWVPRDNQKCLKGAGKWGRGRDQEARKGAQLHCASGLRGGSRGGGLGKRLGKRGRGPAAVASTPGPAATLLMPSECLGRAPSGLGCPSGSASGSSKASCSCPCRFPTPRIGCYEVVAP